MRFHIIFLVATLFSIAAFGQVKTPRSSSGKAKSKPSPPVVTDMNLVREALAAQFAKIGETGRTKHAVVLTLPVDEFFAKDSATLNLEKGAVMNELAAALKSVRGTPVIIKVFSDNQGKRLAREELCQK
ncbi:MAG: hypothetical protein HC902_01045, partial [Calothrix sp. SM1_5_4]|nr:hypothetical protein [Calothrix sp. SM1_5_4]